MKIIYLMLIGIVNFQVVDGQTCVATITASGPTAFCEGQSVILTANENTTWTRKANFGGVSRYNSVAFGIGTKIYVGTGTESIPENTLKNDFWEYDPAGDTWSQKANFAGGPRQSAVAFSIGNKGYVGTGLENTEKNDFWEFDPTANTWLQKASFAGTPRYGSVGFSIGNKGFIGTGADLQGIRTNDFWQYDPFTNIWTRKADFGGPSRYLGVGFSIAKKGYIGTGASGHSSELKDFWEYDPAVDNWTKKPDLAGAGRNAAVGFRIANKGYIALGFDGISSHLKDVWEYDPAFNQWIRKEDFTGNARGNSIAVGLATKAYIGTGSENLTAKNDFWEFDPDINTYLWSNGETTPVIKVTTTGIYTVTITQKDGCSVTSDQIETEQTNCKNYYSKFPGDLHNLSTWGVNEDGSGQQPTDFGEGKIFHLRNLIPDNNVGFVHYKLTGDWAVGGIITLPATTNIFPAYLSLNHHTLTLSSTIEIEPGGFRIGGLLGGPNSSLVIKGNVLAFFGVSAFVGQTAELKDLTIEQYASATFINPLNIFGTLNIKNGYISSNYPVTLKSTAAGTARVEQYNNNPDFNITVERFIPARRAWRLLCSPLDGPQTINQAWQEHNLDPQPNTGTIITGGSTAMGFDPANGANPSILTFDNPTNSWKPIANTNNTQVGFGPYMVFVRGDRTVPANVNIPPTNTTLRSIGRLIAGDQTFTVNRNGFTAIRNPFASPIDFDLINRTNTRKNFYVWDPKLGGTYGVGAWVLVSYNGTNYTVTPRPVSPESQYIQSGQGFMVQAFDPTKDAHIIIGEYSKASTPSANVFRSAPISALRTTLQIEESDKSESTLDEAMVSYGQNFSNTIDDLDAPKPSNFTENLSLLHNGTELMLERRQPTANTDTLFFKMWNMEKKAYQLKFTPENFASLPYRYAGLADKYLKTFTPVSLSEPTNIKFKVDGNAASSNPQRFMVVLSKDKLSNAITSGKGSFKVLPNPVNGRTIQLQFINQPKGIYAIELVNSLGQIMYRNQVQHPEGNEVIEITFKNNIAKGMYQLHMSGAGTTVKTTLPLILN
ncbi:MAG: T9SS type A sorting domain-containing protein [Chitinophagaceae bacterium]|nr:T9SS type A sorting domain-containing protein [Chitinophagaceae bacterium]